MRGSPAGMWPVNINKHEANLWQDVKLQIVSFSAAEMKSIQKSNSRTDAEK